MQFPPHKNIVDLLEFESGKITMGSDRFLLSNTRAMGTLIRDLISTLGKERAKGFLVRHGWSCGFNDAISIQKKYPDATLSFLIGQGPIIHSSEGVGEAVDIEFRADPNKGTFYREGYWLHSYEAEQHVHHFGRSDEPVCWMMTGFASGFCSSMFGKRILYKEVECVARGDERCHYIGKTVEEWGKEGTHDLAYYKEDKINEELVEAHRNINEKNRLLQKIMNFHTTLNHMALEGKSTQVIIDELGQTVKAPVMLEDELFKPIHWYLPTTKKMPESSIQPYLLASIVEQSSEFSARLNKIKLEKSAVHLSSIEKTKAHPRTIAPIIAGQEFVGYLSIIHLDQPDQEFMMMAVERAATVLSFVALKEQTALETEHRLKGDFLDELLTDGAPMELLEKRARYMGYHFNTPHRFLLISTNRHLSLQSQTREENEQMLTARKKVANTVRMVLNTFSKNALIGEKREGMIVLTNISDDGVEELDYIIKNIQNRCNEMIPDLMFSVCVSRESHSIEQLRPVFEECQNTFNVMKRIRQNKEVIFVEKVTLFDLLYASPSQEQLNMYAEQILENLLEYDEKYGGAQLVQTLYVFLENKCNHQQTSRALNVSSSGLKYRMRRLQEVGEIELEDPKERFNLQLALNILIANGRISLE